MKFVTISLVAALAALSLTSSAAARGGGGTSEFLDYVGPTQIPVTEGGSATMSLCHLVKKTHALFIPLWYESEGYVFSDANCAGESYYSLPAEAITEARALGLIGADIPEAPELTGLQKLVPWLWGAVVLLIALSALRAKLRQGARRREMSGADGAAVLLIDAMCHAAKADGTVDDREIAVIADIAQQLTGVTYPPDKIRRMADLSDKNLSGGDFVKFGKGLGPSQRELVMQAVLMVVGADGELAPTERKFVAGLAGGLGLSEVQFNQVMAQARAATA